MRSHPNVEAIQKEEWARDRKRESHVPILTLCAPSSMQDLSSQIGSLTSLQRPPGGQRRHQRGGSSSRRLGHTTISSLQPSMLPLTFSTLSQQSLTLREHRWLVRLAAPARGPHRCCTAQAPGLPLPLPKLLLHLQQYFFCVIWSAIDFNCDNLWDLHCCYKLEKWNIFYWY